MTALGGAFYFLAMRLAAALLRLVNWRGDAFVLNRRSV
jgi:hypothetical protein